MSSFLHFSVRQYAVISVRTLPHSERLVVAYPDEKTLRDLLAGPSIVALGYSSREEAETSLRRFGSAAEPLRRKSVARFVGNSTLTVKRFVSSHLLAKNAFTSGKKKNLIYGLAQHALAAAVVVLYSRNVLSAAIRALISF